MRGPESRSTVTNREGAFAFTALPSGDYELRASLEGVSTIVQKITVSETTNPLKIRMRVAPRGSDVEIIFIATGQTSHTLTDLAPRLGTDRRSPP
ncbi:MAG: carboxypeptidase regulatory-like domain-containing protein [Vicinamibacterales bacterium]